MREKLRLPLKCERCEFLPDAFLNKRASALLGRQRNLNQLIVALVTLLLLAFAGYLLEFNHRKTVTEADRRLNHEENQAILKELRQRCERLEPQ